MASAPDKMASAPDKTRLIDRVGGRLISRFINFTYDTSTPPEYMAEYAAVFRNQHPFIIAIWHGQFMLLPILARTGIPTRAMLAMHRDARMMALALQHFDVDLIRGAGAGIKGKNRGGANAFRGAVHALEDGFSVAMTADVPPGPARRAGHGIVTLAKVTGRPIIPVALASSRYTALNTWSRMTINLPWSRIGASIGEMISVPANATPDELERLRQEVEEQLNIATFDAYARAGADPRRATPGAALSSIGGVEPLGAKLKAYRHLTSLARPLAPLVLGWREGKGKEDHQRRPERFGIASEPRPQKPVVWLHAASVGETTAALPLITALAKKRPHHAFLLTTGTVTSARLAASRLEPGVIHQYVPLDASAYLARFLDHWRPSLAILTESEIWPNLVLETTDRLIPMVIVNGRMSKRSQRRWRRNASMSRPLFSRFDLVLAQNKATALRFQELGASRTLAVGNLKIDAPPLPVDAGARAALSGALGRRPILLAASTHEGEEAILADAHAILARELPNLCTIIVPRHPDRGGKIAFELAGRGLSVKRRGLGQLPAAGTALYIADTLGELGTFLSLASVTFVGKSLPPAAGGHNPIEVVRHDAAVLTGPAWGNFDDEYRALLAAGGAIEVKSAEDLATTAGRLLRDRGELDSMRGRAQAVVGKLSGALALTVDALLPLLPDVVPPTAPHDAVLEDATRA